MKIIVVHDKYGDEYYDASSYTKMLSAVESCDPQGAWALLEWRSDRGYEYEGVEIRYVVRIEPDRAPLDRALDDVQQFAANEGLAKPGVSFADDPDLDLES